MTEALKSMAKEYRRAADVGGVPALARTYLLIASTELLLRWRLAEASAGGKVPEEHAGGHRLGRMLEALAGLPRWSAAVASLPAPSRSWWDHINAVDKYLGAFRYPCPPYDDSDVPSPTGAEPGLPSEATGRRFREECERLWRAFGDVD